MGTYKYVVKHPMRFLHLLTKTYGHGFSQNFPSRIIYLYVENKHEKFSPEGEVQSSYFWK